MILTAITVVLPVFFVLALGYFAGRARKFDPDQVAGLNELFTRTVALLFYTRQPRSGSAALSLFNHRVHVVTLTAKRAYQLRTTRQFRL